MNRIEKILMAVILIIITVLATLIVLIGNAGANGSEINNIINNGAGYATLNLNDLKERDDLFCLQHGKTLSGRRNYTYNVSRRITISGNKMDDGLTNDIVNGTLAYILYEGTQTGGYGHDNNYSGYGDGQLALYHYYETWYNRTKQILGEQGVESFIEPVVANKDAELSQRANEIITEASNYANSIGTSENQKVSYREQDKNRVKVNQYEDNDTTYLIIGPFRWNFSGNITDIKVYFDNQNTAFNDFDIMKYEGTRKKIINKNQITSGRDFYLRVDASKIIDYKKLGKIEATNSVTNNDIITANMWFLKHSNTQNLLLVQAGKGPQTESFNDTFNYDTPITKDIKIIKTSNKKKNGRKLKLGNVEFIIRNKETGKYLVKENGTRKWKYANLTPSEIIAQHGNEVMRFKTKNSGTDKGTVVIEGLPIAEYVVYEVANPNEGYEIPEEGTVIATNVRQKTIENKYKLGTLKLEKVDKDHPEIKLPNVEFTLKALSGKYEGKYVGVDSDGNATYSDNEVNIKTNNEGKITINKIWEGKYQLKEVNNPNYGYEMVKDDIELTVVPMRTTSETVENEQKYIKLSGYIWKDIHSSKSTMRNDYYKNNIPSDYHDDNDQAFNGITVSLKYIDENGNHTVVKQTVSNENGLYDEIDGGEYIFEDVLMKDSNGNNILNRYYIEFQYDGLIYQSVIVHLDSDRGSKAEDKVDRDLLDKNFATIDSTGENKVNVNNKYFITYNETVNHETSIKDSSACVVNARTNDAGYKIEDNFVPGQPEIRYINLGLYEKPQADLALAQDLENVNIGVNGYWHIYKYGTKSYDDNSSSWNVGVKFKNEYTGKYKRAIYKSDIEYQTEEKSKELQVYLTYKIALKNESSYLTKVNSIVDYFDDRYTLVVAGTGVDEQNNITGELNCKSVEKYNDEYQKCIIDVNSTIQKGEANYIYVQFKLDREAVMAIINNGETLYNRTEINSYTVYKDGNGNTVAALDKDSVPGNAKIENIETYEDDIDVASPIQLEIGPDARKIQGTVFEDNKGLSAELQTGEERKGNGVLEEEEPRIAGVKVKLHELNNSIPDMEYVTEADGNFSFDSYIPGKYIITYTWGDKTYTVQNYKGTIYDSSRNQEDMYWYKDSVDTRKTDAIDDYNIRVKIDNEIAAITDNTIYQQIVDAYDGKESNIKTITMNSFTPTMEFSVEYETTVTDGTDDKIEFIVKNVDFGIVERARQQLDMRKRVKAFKIVLANEQVLIDATVNEKGELEGTHKYLTYMGPVVTNDYLYNGFIKAELDNELLQGARLEVTYEIKFVNNSEADYMSEKYYKYGIVDGNEVTITPTGVVDYLDRGVDFEANKNNGWREITENELINLKAEKVGNTEFLNSRMMLYTENTKKPIKPNEQVATDLYVSKLLTTSGDMRFNNDAESVTIDKPDMPVPPSSEPPSSIPHRGSVIKYFPSFSAEEVEVTPSTGEDRAYVVPLITGMMSLVILGVGTIIIKKKLIDSK